MKKIILAIIGLAFAFAFSSCCNQSPQQMGRCDRRPDRHNDQFKQMQQDQQDQQPQQDRQYRRW